MNSPTTRWKDIWLLWACGVVAAAEFGKFASLIPELRQTYGFSLTTAGWLSSIIEIGGATLGLVAGRFAQRIGTRRAIQTGLALLTLGCVAEYSLGPAGLWLGRVAEAAGYLLVAVAAPSLIVAVATSADRPHAFSLWSTFVPVGLALGAVGSAVAVSKFGLSTTLGLWALLPALLLGMTMSLPVQSPEGASTPSGHLQFPQREVWLLCAAFGCYAVLFTGVVAMLPTFLQVNMQTSIVVSGLVVGCASFSTILGSAFLSWRIRRDKSAFKPSTIWELEFFGMAIPAAMLTWLFFQSDTRLPFVVGVSALAILALALTGIMGALLFALVSDVSHRSPKSHPAIIQGLLSHFGASGSLIGPPLVAWTASSAGWPIVAILVAGLAVACIAVEVWSRRIWEARQA